MDFTEISTIIFVLIGLWGSLYILDKALHFKRFGLALKPFYLVWRTLRLNNFLKKTALSYPRLWHLLGTIGIAVGVGLQGFSVYFIAQNLLTFIYIPANASLLLPPIPGVTISLYWLPYFFAAVAINILFHELAHGIIAQADGVQIKSSALFLLAVIPGGYVEIDDEAFRKTKLTSKLRVLGAGSTTNLIIALIALLLITSLYAIPSGVLVTGVLSGGAAETARLKIGDIIYSVNGTGMKDVFVFSNYMSTVKPGQVVALESSSGLIQVTTRQDPSNSSRSYLGIYRDNHYSSPLDILGPFTSYNILSTINWVLLVGLSMAIFNMLPIYPFDGGHFTNAVVEKYAPKRGKKIVYAINVALIGLLILNMGLSALRLGL